MLLFICNARVEPVWSSIIVQLQEFGHALASWLTSCISPLFGWIVAARVSSEAHTGQIQPKLNTGLHTERSQSCACGLNFVHQNKNKKFWESLRFLMRHLFWFYSQSECWCLTVYKTLCFHVRCFRYLIFWQCFGGFTTDPNAYVT